MSDLDRLRSFLAVHRAGSVTAAARQLHLSQPAVSQQVRALEELAGRQLFRRMRRGVEPTPAGRELAVEVAGALDALEEAWGHWLGATGGDGSLDGASVFLGGPSEFLVNRVLPALAPLASAGLRLRVQMGDDAEVLDGLLGGELDLVVLATDPRRDDVSTDLIAREEFVLVAAPDVAAEVGRIEDAAGGHRALVGVPLLEYAESMPLARRYWREVFHADPPGVAAVVANSLPALVGLAERGLGVAVLPSHACEDQLASRQLVRLLRPATPPQSDLYLAWRAGSRTSPAIAAAHARIDTVIGAHARRGA